MTTQTLPTPKAIAAKPAAARDGAESNRTGLLQRAYRASRNFVAEKQRRYTLEREIEQSIAHLRRLTDDQLRDMGITRMDIERAVRHGKDGA